MIDRDTKPGTEVRWCPPGLATPQQEWLVRIFKKGRFEYAKLGNYPTRRGGYFERDVLLHEVRLPTEAELAYQRLVERRNELWNRLHALEERVHKMDPAELDEIEAALDKL